VIVDRFYLASGDESARNTLAHDEKDFRDREWMLYQETVAYALTTDAL
jgi:hypothetical protein